MEILSHAALAETLMQTFPYHQVSNGQWLVVMQYTIASFV